MLALDPKKLAETSIPVSTGWLLGPRMQADPYRICLWVKNRRMLR